MPLRGRCDYHGWSLLLEATDQLLLRQAHALGNLGLGKPILLAKSLEQAGKLIRGTDGKFVGHT